MLDFLKKKVFRPSNNGNGGAELELEEIKAPVIDDVLASIDKALAAREEQTGQDQSRCGCW